MSITDLALVERVISLFRSGRVADPAEIAYERVVRQARLPVFFTDFGVPDTLDGRFELICLFAFLYLHRLKSEGRDGQVLSQAFFDRMFADFDRSLREMGTGDLSVGRQVKRMAAGFYGRIRAYEDGLAGEDEALCAALARNLYGTLDRPPSAIAAVAAYLREAAEGLRGQQSAELFAGRVEFPVPPGFAAGMKSNAGAEPPA